ncbi:MAG: hypothetical protein A3K19_09290 [Lentisphaerae bacterium RIFOXYB12_FULL_65_16]|nr:MAG: hypothetical protein A3K18_14590 [Lentisphaerae bacterium RIFOXYA12_64_32]OGV90380.1 MAG: hypothetical protein A3K19_09290 [Lentisphaerae bacterium RIFOXYB12_FULL_65_16]
MSTDSVTHVGTVGGVDINTLVSSLMQSEQAPLIQLQNEIVTEQDKLGRWTDVEARLSTLQGKTTQLTTASVWEQMSATVTQTTSVLSASAESTASEASYDIDVSFLAKSHRIGSDAQASASDALTLTGDFTVGGQLITVVSGDSVRTIADKINAAASSMTDANKVRASVVDTTLVLDRVQTGTTAISLSDGTNGVLKTLGVLDAGDAVNHVLQEGHNLEMTVNGVSVNRATNTGLTDVISDVTLSFSATGTSNLAVARDTASIKTLLQDFISAYNSAMTKIKSEGVATVSTTNSVTAGPLVGDSLLRAIGGRSRELVTGTAATDPDISADFDTLRKIGITTSGVDNSLTIDSAILDEALLNHFDAVEALIRDPEAGVMKQFDTYLSGLLKPTEGTLDQRQSAINENISRRNDTVARMERNLTVYQNSLYEQFSYVQNVISELDQQRSYLSGIL